MKTKGFILFGLLVLGFQILGLKAQDSLRVYDLAVTKYRALDSVKMNSHPAPATKPLNLSVLFKVKNPQTTTTVTVQIGKQQNGTEYQSQTFSIANHNGSFFLNSGGLDVSQFWGNAVNYQVSVPWSSMGNVKWVTVYLQDNTGHYSAKKYFPIQ